MAKRTLIMCADTAVLAFDFDAGGVEVFREDLLPYPLKGRLREMPEFPAGCAPSYMASQMLIVSRANEGAIIGWLGSRMLLLSRKNAKWLYNLIKAPQAQDEANRARIALQCRAVSVLDNYWVKTEGESLTWNDVNIRHIPLNEIVTQVALHGKSLTLQGSLNTPEFSTNGAYAKGWRRYPDGRLWLHKLGADGSTESRIEVMCSGLLDKMNVRHVHYEAAEDEGKYVCACPAMSSDAVSILPGEEFVSYCLRGGMDPDTEMYKIDADGLYQMHIVDYLISNRDRHGQNWGFEYDAGTMRILRTHPLFDHNNSFDLETMHDKDAGYVFTDKDATIREFAHDAMKRTDFHFTDDITRRDFITERQFKSFMERAAELGIKAEICKHEKA